MVKTKRPLKLDSPLCVSILYLFVCKSAPPLSLQQNLLQAHHGGAWTATVAHIERVKSYAPRIYHMVYDIECRPVTTH